MALAKQAKGLVLHVLPFGLATRNPFRQSYYIASRPPSFQYTVGQNLNTICKVFMRSP